jgi:transposase
MDEATSVLFDLDCFRFVDVARVCDGVVQVVVETVETQGMCPECGRASTRVKERPLVRIRDLPVAGQQVDLWWRKRRLVCTETACIRGSFTQTTAEVPSRSRLTRRLRRRLAQAIAGANRAWRRSPASTGCPGRPPIGR